jgi:rhamnosyltransferase
VRLDASVIVRAKDKADTIEATLLSLRQQTVPVEIIVVDSGSTDGTVEIAKRHADRIIEIAPESFSYGGALNVGAAAASASVHFAISAHCVPEYADWIESSLKLYADERVAATNQARETPSGEPIEGCYLQTTDDVLLNPGWGFSNHASSWRADVWESFRFDPTLAACEDKEWSWRVLSAGWRIAYSPHLSVPADHRRKEGVVRLRRRVAKEAAAMVSLGATRPLVRQEAVRLWWSHFAVPGWKPKAVRRFSPYRIAELSGAVAGGRAPCHQWRPAPLFVDDDPAWQLTRPPYNPLL